MHIHSGASRGQTVPPSKSSFQSSAHCFKSMSHKEIFFLETSNKKHLSFSLCSIMS